MALKDWKKQPKEKLAGIEFNKGIIEFKNKKNKDNILIWTDEKPIMLRIYLNKDKEVIDKEFKSKAEAIKFAKQYMGEN